MKQQPVPRIGQKIAEVVKSGDGLIATMSIWLQQCLKTLGRNPSTDVSTATLSGSPWTWENTSDFDQDVLIFGGNVSNVSFTRDGIAFYTLPLNGAVRLNPGDAVRVTYSAAPTVTIVPR